MDNVISISILSLFRIASFLNNFIPPYPYTTTDLGWVFVRYYRVSNSSFSEPALAPDGTIYISFDDQYLRAVDPNGTIKWVTSLGWLGGFTLTVGSDGLIYAAGDDVTGPKTVIEAVAGARTAAKSIDKFLRSGDRAAP